MKKRCKVLLSLKFEMKAIIAEKDSAFKVIQQELVVIKDFRVSNFELIFRKNGMS